MAVDPVESFHEFLLTKKMQLSAEREVVVKAMLSVHGQFDADQWLESYNSLASGNGSMPRSRSTVYRTMNLLHEAGLVRKVIRADDREVYERNFDTDADNE